ncbi:hypothetical protein QBC42DRAFT_256413 [Cladorrhinum samala]|uniref:Developmental regulatory protein wetA n=1 Tax=Cladorrhinum samala TaxID=585594 RepID=A0AAV9H9T7_9PEZI|nr:hypothetical protein QBC42DRAFT_256413 [Cladorrhinum samala]
MAGVEGMSFLGGGLHLGGNKESGGFYSHDLDEAGSTDFFEQFVMLDDGGGSDTEVTAGEGIGLGHFGVSELSLSPQPTSTSPSIEATLRAHASVGDFGGMAAAGSHPPPSPQQPQHQLHRATSNMAEYTIKSDMDIDSLPFTASSLAGPFGGGGGGGGGGTVSDSELLKLEGLTMRSSPRIEIPQQPASLPASPPSTAASPKKPGRFEAFCSRFRNKTAGSSSKSNKQQLLNGIQPQNAIKQEPASLRHTPIMSVAQMGPSKSSSSPRSKPAHLHLSKSQLASSLSLTAGGPMTAPIPQSVNSASFITATTTPNFLDDPFLNDPLLLRGQFIPSTPHLKSSTTTTTTTNGNGLPQTPHDSWLSSMPSCITVPDGKPLWTSFPDHNNNNNNHLLPIATPSSSASPNWWDGGAADLQMDPDISLSLFFHQQATAAAAAAALYEYPPPPPTTPSCSSFIPPDGLSACQSQSQSQSSRRPKPRAPSSGARHATISPRKTRGGNADPNSPVKPHHPLHHRRSSSSLRGSSDPPNVIRKRSSWTTTATATGGGPSHHHHHQHHHQPSRRASSNSLYAKSKRTASCSSLSGLIMAGRVGGLDNTGSGSGGAGRNGSAGKVGAGGKEGKRGKQIVGCGGGNNNNNNNNGDDDNNTGVTGGGGGGGIAGGGMQGGFVNFTPQDRKLLMTGVAPSGSSKTKARREKEAMERDREYKEKLARAVEAAGGDLRKLEELTGGGVGQQVGMGGMGGGGMGGGGGGGELGGGGGGGVGVFGIGN